MKKKLIGVFIIFLLLAVAGVFWWQDQKEVRELNKNLPKGVKVVKSLIGQEYKVVNKIDGYSFSVPKEWEGINEIEYVPKKEEKGYIGTSIGLEGKTGGSRIITITMFIVEESDIDLELWAKTFYNKLGLISDFFDKDREREFDIIKTQENVHLIGMYVYFFKNNKAVYTITGGSEKFIRDIISNGKW